MPSKNSPDPQRARGSAKRTHSKLERNLVPALLVFMTVAMVIIIMVAIGVVAGLIRY